MSEYQWRYVDHVCRICFGRLSERKGDDGETITRCGQCETEVAGAYRALCVCGQKLFNGKNAGFECIRQKRTEAQPDVIRVRLKGI